MYLLVMGFCMKSVVFYLLSYRLQHLIFLIERLCHILKTRFETLFKMIHSIIECLFQLSEIVSMEIILLKLLRILKRMLEIAEVSDLLHNFYLSYLSSFLLLGISSSVLWRTSGSSLFSNVLSMIIHNQFIRWLRLLVCEILRLICALHL